MKKTILIPLLLVAVVVAALLQPPADPERKAQAVSGLPWQIDSLPDGNSTVFGLTLSRSTFADAREHFGPDMEIAVIARRDETGSLEAYYSRVTTGVLSGKMILVAELDKETVERMRRNAGKSSHTESSAKNSLSGRRIWRSPMAHPLAASASFRPPTSMKKRPLSASVGRANASAPQNTWSTCFTRRREWPSRWTARARNCCSTSHRATLHACGSPS